MWLNIGLNRKQSTTLLNDSPLSRVRRFLERPPASDRQPQQKTGAFPRRAFQGEGPLVRFHRQSGPLVWICRVALIWAVKGYNKNFKNKADGTHTLPAIPPIAP